MATTIDPLFDDQDEGIAVRAADFRLTQYETEHGQLVWEWRHATEPCPQFVSRRVALQWMHEWLANAKEPADP
jgi:hypothetical protein